MVDNRHNNKIGIDLDECLVEFVWAFLDYHNRVYKTKFKREQFYSYNLWETLGESKELTTKKVLDFYKTDSFRDLPIAPGSRETTRALSEYNDLYVITARPDFVSELTIRHIYHNFPHRFSEVIFSNDLFNGNGYKKKSDACKLLDVSLMIEDNQDYALDCASNGVNVLLLDKPWNINYVRHENIKKVRNWDEILHSINGESNGS